MARRAKGPKTDLRGNAWWGWWANGHGDKIYERLFDIHGKPVNRGADDQDVNVAVAREFQKWCEGLDEGAGVTSDKAKRILTLGELTEAYKLSKVAGWKEKTVSAYRCKTALMEQYFGTGCLLSLIRPLDAEGFKIWLTTQDTAPGVKMAGRTVNSTVEFARSVFEYSVTFEILAKNPFANVKSAAEQDVRPRDAFNREEVHLILATSREKYAWFYPAVLVLSISGGRRGPIPRLVVGDFDRTAGVLDVPDKISKQRKSNSLTLPDGIAHELDIITVGQAAREPLFKDESGKPLNSKSA